MHELSIAENIIKLTEEKISQYPGKKPVKVILEIGLLSGIDFDALDFAMQSVVKNTIMENTEIEIIRIEPMAKCRSCENIFKAEDYLSSCPKCLSLDIEFLRGRELLLRSIELE
jgi:hydrogenase nickel incorporation protein HypA/HybF